MGSSKKGYGPSYTAQTDKAYRTGHTNILGDKGSIAQMYDPSNMTIADTIRSSEIDEAISGTPIGAIDPLQRRRVLGGIGQLGQEKSQAAAILDAQQESKDYQLAMRDMQRIQGLGAAKAKKKGAVIGAIAKGGAEAIKLMSDETIKTNILEIEGFTHNFLATLKPYSFKYAEDVGMGGKVIGVMAQDLEKTNIGSTLVYVDEESGKKAIDIPRTVSLLLAVVSDLDKRLKKVEAKQDGIS